MMELQMVVSDRVTDRTIKEIRATKDPITDSEIKTIREIKKTIIIEEDLETTRQTITTTIIQMAASEITLQEIAIRTAALETIQKTEANRIILNKTTIPQEVAVDLDKTIINKKTNS